MKATNKKHIVITGQHNSGKTTLFKELTSPYYGFTTNVIPKDKVILRFNGIADSTVLYTIGEYIPGEGTNRMRPVTSVLDELATIIDNIEFTCSNYFAIDEIGYIEESSPAFCKAITGLFDRYPVIAAVRKQNTALISSIFARDDVLIIDLDNPFGNPGCVIMGSGLGIRFGQNKLMVHLREKPLIGHIISTTQSLFKNTVVVTRHPSIQNYCNSINQKVIIHEFPHRSDTTRIGTEYLTSKSVNNIIFFQGDQPFVSCDSIMAILICAQNEPEKIIRLSYDGSDCSPVLFPACFFDELTALPEGKGGNSIVKKHTDKLIRVEASDRLETVDIDTPEDMALFSI